MIHIKKRVMGKHNASKSDLRAANFHNKNTEIIGDIQVISSPTNGGELE